MAVGVVRDSSQKTGGWAGKMDASSASLTTATRLHLGDVLWQWLVIWVAGWACTGQPESLTTATGIHLGDVLPVAVANDLGGRVRLHRSARIANDCHRTPRGGG